MKKPIEFTNWGIISWADAYHRQIQLRTQRQKNNITDQVFFLEHPPTITMGRRPSWEDLHVSREFLQQRGIALVETDRGGKLTAHEPGQMVVYFIVNIQQRRLTIEKWTWLIEESMMEVLKNLEINVTRDRDNPGLWIGKNKIMSLGFHFQKGVSTHGIALNVDNDLKIFDLFIPCGLPERGVTSIRKEIGHDVHRVKLQNDFRKQLLALLDKKLDEPS